MTNPVNFTKELLESTIIALGRLASQSPHCYATYGKVAVSIDEMPLGKMVLTVLHEDLEKVILSVCINIRKQGKHDSIGLSAYDLRQKAVQLVKAYYDELPPTEIVRLTRNTVAQKLEVKDGS